MAGVICVLRIMGKQTEVIWEEGQVKQPQTGQRQTEVNSPEGMHTHTHTHTTGRRSALRPTPALSREFSLTAGRIHSPTPRERNFLGGGEGGEDLGGSSC